MLAYFLSDLLSFCRWRSGRVVIEGSDSEFETCSAIFVYVYPLLVPMGVGIGVGLPTLGTTLCANRYQLTRNITGNPEVRYKDVNLRGPTKLNKVACKFNLKPLPILSTSNLKPLPNSVLPVLPRGLPSLDLSSASSTVLRGNEAGRSQKSSILLRQCKSSTLVQAKKDNGSITIPFPKMTEKPEWWWRTLACLPYLASLQMSEVGFYVIPFAEHYQLVGDVIYFVPGAIKRLPQWFTLTYFIVAYFGVVKKKQWPHFFRYHVIMALLLETMLQVVGQSSNFFPLINFTCGTFGIEYWAAVAFLYILILLECMRCALAGKYAKLPFFSVPALAHTLFPVEGRYRPF